MTNIKFMKERDAAFLRNDIDWFRRNFPFKPSSDTVVVAAFHKARLEVVSMPYELRRDSADWLLANGMNRTSGSAPHSALEETR